MKILISIPYFEPAWGYGGPPRLITELAHELTKRHDVRVITTDVLDEKNRNTTLHEKNNRLEIFRYPTLSNALAWKTKIILPKGLVKDREKHITWADFIYLSDLRHALNAILYPTIQKYHKPYSLAAFGQIQKPHDGKYVLKIFYDEIIGKKIIRNAHALIAQNNHEASDYLSLGGVQKQIHIIPLGEQPPATTPQAGEIFRKKYQIKTEAKILLFVGRIHKLKGVDTIIKALTLLKPELGQQTRFVIVGRDDGYQNEMRKLITDKNMRAKVLETGPLYGTENAAAYQAADVFVFTPNYYEETSLAAVRALSFGIPIITVPQAEMPYLDKSGAGITCPNSPQSIAETLQSLLVDKQKLSAMKRAAKNLFNTHYTIESMATKTEKIAEEWIKSTS